jgi:hypothetical protein
MGMSRLNVMMQTTVKREALLARLRENRENHARIVAEAKAGYLEAAIRNAEAALTELRAGKPINLQSAVLRLPEDYTSAYDTVIKMLEWSTDDTITLQADEFRQFVEDCWDWKDGFVATNTRYAASLVGAAP